MKPAPKKVPKAREKFEYLAERQSWICAIWLHLRRETPDCRLARKMWPPPRPTDLHHRVHNTETNRKVFPRSIHSLINLVAVNNALHLTMPSFEKKTLLEADRIERTLARWPRACAFVNGQSDRLGWG